MNIPWTRVVLGSLLLAMLAGVGGCSTPSLAPIADEATSMRDEGLAGEWKSDDYRATVSTPSEKGVSKVTISAVGDGEIKGSLNLELRATRLRERRYLDLFLAKSERRKLVDQYGGLVIPTHQIMRYTLEGDTLKVWMLKEGSLPGTQGRARIEYPEDDTQVLTADTAALRAMIEAAPEDAFGSPTEFRRVR